MPELSDLELIEQAIKGQDEALAALIQRYITPVYRFLCRLVGDSATAEDLAQETFLKAWKGLPGFDRKKSLKHGFFRLRNTRRSIFCVNDNRSPLRHLKMRKCLILANILLIRSRYLQNLRSEPILRRNCSGGWIN